MELVLQIAPKAQDLIIEQAKRILKHRMTVKGATYGGATEVKTFLSLDLALEEREVFGVMFMDGQNKFIKYKNLFFGTISSVEVQPREIIREALKINAKSLILSHNHPSGCAEPSHADRSITNQIVKAAKLLSIYILDHIVIGKSETVSFAERGWI